VLAQTTSARRSVQPVSSARASSPSPTRPAGTPRRRSPVSSMRCPPIRFRRPGSGCPAVRCPVTWGRRPESPALGRLLSTRPVSSRPLSSRPVSAPSGRVRLLPCSGGWRWGPGRAGRATVITGTGGGPGGCRAVDGSIDGRGGRRDAGDAAKVALVTGRSVADPGRRVGCGPRRPRCPLSDQAGQAAVGGARRGGAVGTGAGGRAKWRHPPPGWCPRLAQRPRWVVVVESDARVGGPGGAPGGAGGDGRAAPARPKPAANAARSAPAAL